MRQYRCIIALLFVFFTFCVYPATCLADHIISAEYYFDTDPGEGNGTSIPAADGAFDAFEEDIDISGIDTSGLTIDSHTLYVRFKNAEGVWGIARPLANDATYPSPANFKITGDKWIAGAECFIDLDPGEGNGLAVAAEDGLFDEAEESLILNDINISTLDPGLHSLYLRLQDNEGNWGVIREYVLEKYALLTITAAEYFIDTDPGSGSGITLSAKDGRFDSAEENVELSGIDTSGLTEGVHSLSVRFRDNHDRWGMAFEQPFAVNRPVAYSATTPVQPVDGIGEISLSVIVADVNGAPCKLKIEYRSQNDGEWNWATIKPASVSAVSGTTPGLDNSAEYQIGTDGSLIVTSAGANTVSFIWLYGQDLGAVDSKDVMLRFTVFNGINEQTTMTESQAFFVDLISPAAPVLYPYSPDPTGDSTPEFTWHQTSEAVNYQLQIAPDADFNTITLDQAGITSPRFIATAPLPVGDQYWRVRSFDVAGNASSWSAVDHFILIADSQPPTVSLSYSAVGPVAAGPLTITAIFSEPLISVPKIAIDLPGSLDIAPVMMHGRGTNWSFSFSIHCSDGTIYQDGTAIVNVSGGLDSAGNENSPAANNTFVIDTSTCSSGIIIAAEYYFDTDPGEGNGTSIPAADGAFNAFEENIDISGIDTSSLTIGSHTLYVRFKNAEGVWGIARPLANDATYTSPVNFKITGDKWIAGAECFIDLDPGEGNGLAVEAADGQFDEAEEDLNLNNIGISNLDPGLHTLYLRLLDSEGSWGVVREYAFEKYAPLTITAAEYFIDTDQGPGSGIALSAKDGRFDSAEEDVELSGIDTSSLEEGVHSLSVRFRDSQDRWGSILTWEFIVGNFLGDEDEDGMPNGWENDNGLNPTDPTDAAGDLDGDGLTNLDEYLQGTDPQSIDSDNDGMPDGWEVEHDLSPSDPDDATNDLDQDGLDNLDEYLYGTDVLKADTDGDGISDGDEIKSGGDPLIYSSVRVAFESSDVLVSLAGDNRIFVKVFNEYPWIRNVQFYLIGLDPSWYTIEDKFRQFNLLPFEVKTIPVQLHLPLDCTIALVQYPFSVNVDWEKDNIPQTSSDVGNLRITTQPSVTQLAIPDKPILAGNTIFTAWRTDVPATSHLYYRKLGDTDFIQVNAGVDVYGHTISIPNLEYFTFYELYTENYSICDGHTASEIQTVKTGKAVKFVEGVNEFWVDREYNQSVILTISNTDIIEHSYDLSVINDSEDIVVGFIGGGSNGRKATLAPGDFMDVELLIHAPDALKTNYDIYLKIVSDEGEFNSFVDFSHAIVHVHPSVANLDIQPVESNPTDDEYGMMSFKFRLFNYGDTLNDIKVYVDEESYPLVSINPTINHLRLEQGEFKEFFLKADQFVSGTVYVEAADGYIVSAPFEIGCPTGTNLNTYSVNDVHIAAEIGDWYCTNKLQLELPFALPSKGLDLSNISAAWLDVNFSLPMSNEKYDPHTVRLSINGEHIDTLENVIPEGPYSFRFSPNVLKLGWDGYTQNILTVEADGIGEGQYIVVTDFKVHLNIDEMDVDLCVEPPMPPPQPIPPAGKTTILDIGPNEKFRPGASVPISLELHNTDSISHQGRITIQLANNSYQGAVAANSIIKDIIVPPGKWVIIHPDYFDQYIDKKKEESGASEYSVRLLDVLDVDDLLYSIPLEIDDIEYAATINFENATTGDTQARVENWAFWVRRPLVIVHGILGSKLIRTDTINKDVVWGSFYDFLKALGPGSIDHWSNVVFEEWLKYLEFNEDESPVYSAVKPTRTIVSMLKIDSLDTQFLGKGVDTFDGLQDYLSEKRYIYHPIGFEEDFVLQNFSLPANYQEDVFYFVYDWRQDNKISADQLKQFIQKITDASQQGLNSSVNIVAHSMGGLVTKSLMSDTGVNSINDKVNKVIFVGTPHYGAAKALSTLKYGGNDFFLDKAFYQNISKNLPSLYQLLPSERFFEIYTQGFYFLDNQSMTYSSQPSLRDEIALFGNETMFDEAVNLHQSIDIDTFLSQDNTYSIAGCRQETLHIIEEPVGESTYPYQDGDETVPLLSALAVNANKKYAAHAVHSNLPSHKGVRKLIRSLLKGFDTDYERDFSYPVEEYTSENSEFCGLPNGTKIHIDLCDIIPCDFQLFRPDFVWPQVTLPTGEKIIFTGNEVHLGIIGSDYRFTNSGIEIFVPEGQVYSLKFEGVDSEYLNIKFQLMTGGGVNKTYVFFNIPINTEGCGEITINLEDYMTNPVLRLDEYCDGSFEHAGIPPDVILDETEANDFNPPTTGVNVAGTLGANGWYTSNVSIALTGTDSPDPGGSGVLVTRYRFEDELSYSDYSVPLSITEPGTYTLYYYSIDKNLNKEVEQTLELKVDQVSPQITNLTDAGYFSLGLSSFDAAWDSQVGISGIDNIRYSIGTSPGATDIVNWTSSEPVSELSLDGLSLIENCTSAYYINVQAVGLNGLSSSIVSTDGAIALGAGGDPDGDGYVNENELTAESNACNANSTPKETTIHLEKGFNLVGIPSDVMFRPDLKDWLPILGNSNEIEKVMYFDKNANKYVTLIPEQPTNQSYILQGGEALIVYAKIEKDVNFASRLCNPIDLHSGFNFTAISCSIENYSAFDFLNDYGSETIVSIQRFSIGTGVFQTAAFAPDNSPVGVDFPIISGEGYFVYVK